MLIYLQLILGLLVVLSFGLIEHFASSHSLLSNPWIDGSINLMLAVFVIGLMEPLENTTMRIRWMSYSLEIEKDSIVHVQQQECPFEIHFEGFKSVLLVNAKQINIWRKMSLEKIYQSSQCNFEELKQYLASSPFSSILRTEFGRISKQDQLRVIKDLAILSRVDLLHLKEPSKFFLDHDVDQFSFSVDRPCIIESFYLVDTVVQVG